MEDRQKDAIAAMFGGETLERLLTADVGAATLGELALSGAALGQLGASLTAAAKDGAELAIAGLPDGKSAFVDGGVSFQWRDGYARVGVKAAAVKKAYPVEDYPQFYSTAQVRGGVAITIPKTA